MPSLSPNWLRQLRCPVCANALEASRDVLRCGPGGCGAGFPIVSGVPVLLNEANSMFRLADFSGSLPQMLQTEELSIVSRLKRLVPANGVNLHAQRNFRRLRDLLLQRPQPSVLIVGGGVLGQGIASFVADPAIDFVETDVWIGPGTKLVCDAHDLPFPDASFDAIYAFESMGYSKDIDAWLNRCWRMLKPGGHGFITAAITAPNEDHIYLYNTAGEVAQQLRACDFQIVDEQEDLAYQPRADEPVPRLVAYIVR
jgi:SAM-dependent methyltransferase